MRKWFSSIILLLGVFLMPVLAFADGENPITKMKEQMKFNWGVLDGLGFLFYIIMIPLTLMVIILIVWCIWSVITKFMKIRRGKESLKDTPFWVEIGVTLLILFMFISGAFWSILEKVYDWTSKQKIGEEQGTAMVTPHSQTKIIIQYPDVKFESESFLA